MSDIGFCLCFAKTPAKQNVATGEGEEVWKELFLFGKLRSKKRVSRRRKARSGGMNRDARTVSSASMGGRNSVEGTWWRGGMLLVWGAAMVMFQGSGQNTKDAEGY